MKRLAAIALALILSSCTGGDIYRRVARDQRTCPGKELCVLRELYRFRWDSVYVLYGEGALPEGLRNRFFAPDDTGDRDLSRKIIFIRGEAVVRVESETKISEPHPVSFDLGERDWGVFTPEDAVLRVEKQDYGDETYYELTPVGSDDNNQ